MLVVVGVVDALHKGLAVINFVGEGALQQTMQHGGVCGAQHHGGEVVTLGDLAPVHTTAEAVLEQTRGRELRYPIALDLEDERLEKLKKRELGEVIKAFCGAVRAGGRIPMIYSNLDWFKNRIPKSAVKGEYVWLACWRDSLPDEDFGCAMAK